MVRTRKKRNEPKGSIREKGDIAKQSVASMHMELGAKVEMDMHPYKEQK